MSWELDRVRRMRDIDPDAGFLADGSGATVRFATRPGLRDIEAACEEGNGIPDTHRVADRVASELAHGTAGGRAAADIFGDLFVEVALVGVAVANDLVDAISDATTAHVGEDLPCFESHISRFERFGWVTERSAPVERRCITKSM